MSSSATSEQTTTPALPIQQNSIWPTVLLVAACYVPIALTGYGTDDDIKLAFWAGERVLDGHAYIPSRNPGYLLHEIVGATLARLGGYALVNSVSVLCGLISVALVQRIAEQTAVPSARFAAVVFGLHPLVWIGGTSSMDYMWALAPFLGGALSFARGQWRLPFLLFGLAIAVRASMVVPVAALLIISAAMRPKSFFATVLGASLSVAVSAPWYLPSLYWSIREHGDPTAFLAPHLGDPAMWTWTLLLGRFLFKNLTYVVGVPAAVGLFIVLIFSGRKMYGTLLNIYKHGRLDFARWSAIIIGTEILFCGIH